jgi:hypothetical protein
VRVAVIGTGHIGGTIGPAVACAGNDVLRSGDSAGLLREMWVLLTLYQALRIAITDVIETMPAGARNVVTATGLADGISRAVLASLHGPRRHGHGRARPGRQGLLPDGREGRLGLSFAQVEPVEVGRGSEVEQHVDPAELTHRQLDKRPALGGVGETARLHGDHLAARGVNHLYGRCRRLGDHVAADDRRALAGERQGSGASHTPAGSRDDADFSCQPAGRLKVRPELTWAPRAPWSEPRRRLPAVRCLCGVRAANARRRRR